MKSIIKRDPQVASIMQQELQRQQNTLQMIPSENYASPAVLAASGSVLNNKYAEGYPGKRYYQGNIHVDEIENIAISRAKKLFGAEHANVQPLSGAPALTTRGMKEPEMKDIGRMIAAIANNTENAAIKEEVKPKALALCAAFPIYGELT